MNDFKVISLCLVFFLGKNLLAQIPAFPDDSLNKNVILLDKGNIVIEGDGRIGELEERYKKINEKEKKINGYRIQIFSNSGTQSYDQAMEVQTEFLKIYPDIKSYIIHQKPRFKVRIGDYRTRLDAERFYIELKENFPDAFIVRDRINFPVLEIEKKDDK